MTGPTLFLTVGLPAPEDHSCAAHRGRAPSTSSHEGRMGEGSLRARESAIGPGRVEGRLIQVGLRALELGINVVIDYGLWGQDERSALRQAAADRGAVVEMRYFNSPSSSGATDQRRPKPTHDLAHVPGGVRPPKIDVPTPGQLDGAPFDDPPAGFATWAEWRSFAGHRRSPSSPPAPYVTAGVRRPARRSRSRAPAGPAAAGSRTGRRAASRRSRRRRSPGCGGPRR